MARIGSFLGPTQIYGAPLSVVHPPDNNVASSRYNQALMDPNLNLDEATRRDLQAQIDELTAVLKTGRDLPPVS